MEIKIGRNILGWHSPYLVCVHPYTISCLLKLSKRVDPKFTTTAFFPDIMPTMAGIPTPLRGFLSLGASINYVDKQRGSRGRPNVNDTTEAYWVNLSIENLSTCPNSINVVYGCPFCHFFISEQKTSRCGTLIDPSRIEFFEEKNHFLPRRFLGLLDRKIEMDRSDNTAFFRSNAMSCGKCVFPKYYVLLRLFCYWMREP